MDVLELHSLPCDILNVTLHLSVSVILVSQDSIQWGAWTADIMRCVSGRGTSGRGLGMAMEEVAVIIIFFQELSQQLGGSWQVITPYLVKLSSFNFPFFLCN